MHVLVLTMYYAPDLTGIATIATDLCQYLVSEGHRVSVLAGPPHYPAWKVPEAYKGKVWLRETIRGVEVHRGYVFVPTHRSTIKRILYDTSLAVSSIFTGFRVSDVDLVLAITPPLQLGITGILLSRIKNAPLILKVQDLVPDLAVAVGMLRNKHLLRLAYALERYIYRKSSAILLLSEGFVRNLKLKGIPESKLVLHPNFVDTQAIRPMVRNGDWRKAFNFRDDHFIVLHTGNIGAKQSLETVLDAAQQMLDLRSLQFVIVGNGTERDALEARARAANLTNVVFLPLQPAEKLSEMLSCADVLLLNQSPTVVEMVMPGKLLVYMASGRPVVAAVDANSETADYIQRAGCGVVVPPADPEALANAIRGIYERPATGEQLGRSGRIFAEENFEQQRNLTFFEDVLKTVKAGQPPRQTMPANRTATQKQS